MVATAPGEKLLIGHRPVRNWTQLQFFSLFQQKLLPPELHFLTPICTNRLSAGAFHWGELTALPPDLPAAFKRPTSKKRGGEGRGRKRRGDEEREGKEGVRYLP